jgi:hypothetical protein
VEVQSTYNGLLVLPDGREIRIGDTITLGKDVANNKGVMMWIEAGYLVKAAAKK